ncbi:MAG: GNAT family N-acetyltransferase [Acetobacteraceae bacterium]
MAIYPADLEERWLAGGEPLVIRPIRPSDAAAHEAFFHRLRPEDVRLRFFATVRSLSPEQIARFTHVDYEHSMAFIAVRDATGETVGVARLVSEDDPDIAEFAVTVQPDMQGHGLATHLMQRLLAWAEFRGIRAVVGEVLAENAVMLDLLRRLGFTLRHSPTDAAIIDARLALPDPSIV